MDKIDWIVDLLGAIGAFVFGRDTETLLNRLFCFHLFCIALGGILLTISGIMFETPCFALFVF